MSLSLKFAYFIRKCLSVFLFSLIFAWWSLYPDTPGTFLIYPLSILAKVILLLSQWYCFCSIYSGLSFRATSFFCPFFWPPVYHTCLIFVHPTVFILFPSVRSRFPSMPSALLRWSSTSSNLLFHAPLCGDNPGQRNVITFLVCMSPYLILCRGVSSWNFLYTVSIEVPLPDDTSLSMLVLLIGAHIPGFLSSFWQISYKVKFKGLCFFQQPLSSTQLSTLFFFSLNNCHSLDPVIRHTLTFYWSLVAKENPNWICLFMCFGLRSVFSTRPCYSLKNCFAG